MVDLRHVDWNIGVGGSSDGMLPKAVIEKDNEKYYLKLSSYNVAFGIYGIESITEMVAYRIGRCLGVDCLEYGLLEGIVSLDNKDLNAYVSVSKDFKKGRLTISLERYFTNRENIDETTIEFIRRLKIQESIYKMFVFDYIIMNKDRHGKNIEVFLDTGKQTPLFDNSFSLFNTYEDSKLSNTLEYDDNMRVNNFVGYQNLKDNLGLIDCEIEMRELKKEDQDYIFKDLEEVLSRTRRDIIWNNVYNRYEDIRRVSNEKLLPISWK